MDVFVLYWNNNNKYYTDLFTAVALLKASIMDEGNIFIILCVLYQIYWLFCTFYNFHCFVRSEQTKQTSHQKSWSCSISLVSFCYHAACTFLICRSLGFTLIFNLLNGLYLLPPAFRSNGEGTVFKGVCLFTFRGDGVHHPAKRDGWVEGTPSGWRGTPSYWD